MRRNKMLVLMASLTVALMVPVMLVHASAIDARMASFDVSKVRSPIYTSGVSYSVLMQDPTADNLFSYSVDNWAYAEEIMAQFSGIKEKLITGTQGAIVVAEPTGSFVAVIIDFEEKTLLPGYSEVENELAITSEFLASALVYMDGHTTEEISDYLLSYYDSEWYVVSHGLRVPYWLIAIVSAAAIGSSAMMIGSRKGAKK